MSIDKALLERSGGKCELCGSEEGLREYQVTPKDEAIVICETCSASIEDPTQDATHWHCLSDSMWSMEPAVQVMAYRLLTKLGAQDQLDMLYLEPEVLEWAQAGLQSAAADIVVRDCNGNLLNEGDSVSIIKDLPVKGAGFTAKQGTTVKNIHLVAEDPTHIEGRVNGVKIFLKTEFLKKI
ncbi:MAG: PhnA domain-containing protein [Campylobacterales bacterium]|nr:PhnA domain-containing protein [Campylobacterales bacterium]